MISSFVVLVGWLLLRFSLLGVAVVDLVLGLGYLVVRSAADLICCWILVVFCGWVVLLCL